MEGAKAMGQGLYIYKGHLISHVNEHWIVYKDEVERSKNNPIYYGSDMTDAKNIIDNLIHSNAEEINDTILQ